MSVREYLDSFFPSGTFLAPHVWEEASRWYPNDSHTVELGSGHLLPCAGRMPVICHRGTLSPSALSAMADAGIEVAEDRRPYSSREEYRQHVHSLAADGMKAITPYWTPADVIPPEATWIDPTLLRFLNNKSNLEALVPATSLPPRRIVRDDAAGAIRSMALPLVLKVGTDLPNGGGKGVMVCRRPRHRRRAVERFSTDEAIIFEQLLEIVENHCVQYAMFPDGSVVYLGASSQICLPNGAHAGNLLDPAKPPSSGTLSLGEEIARNGARLGFSGIAGFDIVVTKEGRALALDLNFRPVSSTAQVLLHPRLSVQRGMALSRLAFGRFSGGLDEMLRLCGPFIDAGWVVPLATFDPVFGGAGNGEARSRLLLFGDTTEEIAAREKMLASHGIVIAGHQERRRVQRRAANAFKWLLSQAGLHEKP